MNRRITSLTLALTVVLAMLLAGCNKFTRVRYETVYVGQPDWEVTKTLGEPMVRFSDEWVYENEKPWYKAIIKFEGNKVSGKSWYDSKELEDHPDIKASKSGAAKDPSGTIERHTTTVVE
ncbi:hypothetical protein LCGC14_0274890 [marine sediment metagenome]|uniref:Uncharacterized protein n=1 Tax=marine sediment metagenome TaxID=412755 RepID=A0A0F9WIT5_9ZZZZ|nr:hypothetical protein [Phycisphaerae bacterium]HDZ43372.1 hypothetical protein [Phycisphaerae bacterium]